MYYLLDENGEPFKAKDISEWFSYQSSASPIVKKTFISDCEISTCFLPCCFNGPLLLWETMILGGPIRLHKLQYRCGGSREQALAQHDAVVALVVNEYKKPNGYHPGNTRSGSSKV